MSQLKKMSKLEGIAQVFEETDNGLSLLTPSRQNRDFSDASKFLTSMARHIATDLQLSEPEAVFLIGEEKQGCIVDGELTGSPKSGIEGWISDGNTDLFASLYEE